MVIVITPNRGRTVRLITYSRGSALQVVYITYFALRLCGVKLLALDVTRELNFRAQIAKDYRSSTYDETPVVKECVPAHLNVVYTLHVGSQSGCALPKHA